MEAFSYLSVLLSIILGLAVAQVLQGYRGLLLSRRRITLHAPPLIWSLLTLVMAVQFWWSSFGLAGERDWTFAAFAVVLLQTVLLYMVAGVVLPDIPPDEPLDLSEHYFREKRAFFGLLLAMLAVSVGKEWALEGRWREVLNLAFHGVFAALATAGYFVKSRRFHEVLAPVAGVLLTVYIGILFARL